MVIASEYDLIQAMSGVDEDGHGKCVVSLQAQRQDADGNVKNTDDELVIEKPIVQVFKQAGGYVLVDFVFDSVDDIELKEMYSYIQRFFQASNSTDDDELDFPLLLVSLVPEEYKGQYFAVGINPVFYALTPDDVKGEPTTIRLVFVTQVDDNLVPNFLFLKSDEKALDKMTKEDSEEDEIEDANVVRY